MGSSEPPKRPTDEDVIRERTALRVQRIEPIPVLDILTEEEFLRRYMGRMVVTSLAKEAIPAIEQHRRIVFCKACRKDDELRCVVQVTELCVRYEEDQLRAVPMLALCTCFRCGFEMYVDMKRKPDFRNEREKMDEEIRRTRAEQAERQYAAQLQGNYGGFSQSAAAQQLQGAFNLGQQLGLPASQMEHIRRQMENQMMQDRKQQMIPQRYRKP